MEVTPTNCGGNTIATNVGNAQAGTLRVVVASDQPELATNLTQIKGIQADLVDLPIKKPHVVFRSHFNDGNTENDVWKYEQLGGTGTSESYNATDRSLDITSTTNDDTDLEMSTKQKFNCYGTHYHIYS